MKFEKLSIFPVITYFIIFPPLPHCENMGRMRLTTIEPRRISGENARANAIGHCRTYQTGKCGLIGRIQCERIQM